MIKIKSRTSGKSSVSKDDIKRVADNPALNDSLRKELNVLLQTSEQLESVVTKFNEGRSDVHDFVKTSESLIKPLSKIVKKM